MSDLSHPLTPPPPYGRYVVWALVGHVVLLVVMSVAIDLSIRTHKPMMMQVRLVGVPQPTKTPSKPPEQVEKVRTQDSAAPKEPPPETKNIPPSQAKTKFVQDKPKDEPKKDKPNPVEAKKRPPTLDKTPKKKKVVKNDLDAKVVKNPEDYMAALDFIDKLEAEQLAPKPNATAQKTDEQAGEGPQIQLDASDMGAVDAIRSHIMEQWTVPPGLDVRGLTVVIRVRTSTDGQLTAMPQVLTKSGNAAFDDSLVRAVRKAVPLPVPADDARFGVLDFTFGGE
ncbi:MAG: TonB C-terminal domain-containing protein [Pseudomonadaceae bacterium]|nr:TonB C-terminal domain-containing protein [Pseudomonadaceae bacterium]